MKANIYYFFSQKRNCLLLFLILISFLCLFSCKPSNSLESELGIDTPNVNLLTDTVNFTIRTEIRDDSIRTDQNAFITNLIGEINDPITGKLKAESYFQLALGGENVKFGSNLVLDSVKLHIRFLGKYGNYLDEQVLNIFELSDTINFSSQYFNSSSAPTYTEELSNNFKFNFNDSSTLTLSVPLSVNFGKKILNADSVNLSNNLRFTKFMKGLKVRSNLTSLEGEGAIYLIDWLSSNPATGRRFTRLTLYYKSDNTPREYDLALSLSASSRFTNIQRSLNGSWLQEFKNSPLLQTAYQPIQSTLLIQSLFSIHKNIMQSLNGKAINKAELILPIDRTISPTHPFFHQPPPPNLFQAVNGKPNLARPIGDLAPVYNPKTDAYKYNITSFMQSMVSKSITDTAFYIIPAISPSASNSLHRVVLGNISNAKHKPRLLIYYTNKP